MSIIVEKCTKCKREVSIFELSERGHSWLCPICTVAHDAQVESNESVCREYIDSDIETLLLKLIAENKRLKEALQKIAQGVVYTQPMDIVSERMLIAGNNVSLVMQHIAKVALEI
jgi:hypothetical protein